MTTVADRLRELAKLNEQRDDFYGENYKQAGAVLKALFPQGITLRTEEDFLRFHLLVHIAGKLSRYTARFKLGGHAGSMDDTSVYAAMLRQYSTEEESDGHNAAVREAPTLDTIVNPVGRCA